MNKLFQIVLLMAIPYGMLFGQQAILPNSSMDIQSKAQLKTQIMQEEFNLTPKQIKQVLKINVDYFTKSDSLNMNSVYYPDTEKQEKLKKFNTERTNALKSILSETQMEQYKK